MFSGLKSRNFIVPGLIAVIMAVISALLTSLTISREWERGTMEQLISTPLAIIGFLDTFLVITIGLFWFKIPFRGSFSTFILSTSVFIISALGIGLFISTIAKTMQQAIIVTFLFYSPAVLLSGMIFPIENMPLIFQYMTYLNPLRYFLSIVRGIFLKGSGIEILANQIFPLFLIGFLILFFSFLKFKKRLE